MLPDEQLSRSLKTRHITMIAIGGVIGSGIFVGSSTIIAAAGPAAVISYAISGLIIFLVMRMLGELAASRPGIPSFTEYARVPLGDGAAFLTGWLYAYFWMTVVAFEAVAGAIILKQWVPVPAWVIEVFVLTAFTVTNLFAVRTYGEFEFWFSSIKVGAIIAFFAIAIDFLSGRGRQLPSSEGVRALLTHYGGFAPHGLSTIFANIPAVIFAICGSEVAIIAAAESIQPGPNVARIVRTIVVRIIIFYVGSISLIVMTVPWTKVTPGLSPFVTALRHMNVPYAGLVMTLIILTAILSTLNCGLYVTSRVIHGLALRGHAPRVFMVLDSRRTPVAGVLLTSGFAFVCTLTSTLSLQALFNFLMNASGALMLIVYLLIAAAQIRGRYQLERDPGVVIPVRMWFFPWLSYGAIAGMLAILFAMPFIPGMDSQFYASWAATALLVCIYAVHRWMRTRMSRAAVART